MTWLHWFALIFSVWYLGMGPAAFIAGRQQRALEPDKAGNDVAVVVFVALWPLWLFLLPLIGLHMRGRRKPQPRPPKPPAPPAPARR